MVALSANLTYRNPNPSPNLNPITNPNSKHNIQKLTNKQNVSTFQLVMEHNCAYAHLQPTPGKHDWLLCTWCCNYIHSGCVYSHSILNTSCTQRLPAMSTMLPTLFWVQCMNIHCSTFKSTVMYFTFGIMAATKRTVFNTDWLHTLHWLHSEAAPIPKAGQGHDQSVRPCSTTRCVSCGRPFFQASPAETSLSLIIHQVTEYTSSRVCYIVRRLL